METIFAKILTREIPADIIYEDDTVLAFLDINPVNIGHTLIIPKVYFENIFDGDSQVLAHMMVTAQKISQTLVALNFADGVNIIMNNGAAASQEVWHAHLHVVPRKNNDHSFSKPQHVSCSKEDLQKTFMQLKEALT